MELSGLLQAALKKDMSEAAGKEIMIHRMVKLNIPALSLKKKMQSHKSNFLALLLYIVAAKDDLLLLWLCFLICLCFILLFFTCVQGMFKQSSESGQLLQSAGFGSKFLDTLFLVVPLSGNVGPDGEVIQSIFLFIPSTFILQKMIQYFPRCLFISPSTRVLYCGKC